MNAFRSTRIPDLERATELSAGLIADALGDGRAMSIHDVVRLCADRCLCDQLAIRLALGRLVTDGVIAVDYSGGAAEYTRLDHGTTTRTT